MIVFIYIWKMNLHKNNTEKVKEYINIILTFYYYKNFK